MSSDPLFPARRETDAPTTPRLLPPYHVVLFNDEYHSGEFVTLVLTKVMGWSMEQALACAWEAHDLGRAIVWTGPKEVAEFKLEQLLTYREKRDGIHLGPLDCTIEPAPGT